MLTKVMNLHVWLVMLYIAITSKYMLAIYIFHVYHTRRDFVTIYKILVMNLKQPTQQWPCTCSYSYTDYPGTLEKLKVVCGETILLGIYRIAGLFPEVQIFPNGEF